MLQAAIEYERLEQVDNLFKKGCTVRDPPIAVQPIALESPSQGGEPGYRKASYLVQAAKTGNITIFERILNEGANPRETGFIGFNKRSKAQIISNPLGCSCFHKKWERALFILDKLDGEGMELKTEEVKDTPD